MKSRAANFFIIKHVKGFDLSIKFYIITEHEFRLYKIGALIENYIKFGHFKHFFDILKTLCSKTSNFTLVK